MIMKPRVLFVCVENSCRSQIAEGFGKALGKDVLEAWSAGSKPSGKMNPTAIQVMKEKGINLELQSSKGLNDIPKGIWDYVFTMGCGDTCPLVTSKVREDWAIPDPKDMPLEEFRKVRDLIEVKVRGVIEKI